MKSRPLFQPQDLPPTIRALALWLVTAITACAIADSNNNGVSDIWERHYNSQQPSSVSTLQRTRMAMVGLTKSKRQQVPILFTQKRPSASFSP